MSYFLHHGGHGVSQSLFLLIVFQRSIATKELGYIHFWLRCVLEILRFALDDNKGRKKTPWNSVYSVVNKTHPDGFFKK